jgi:uncharacterized protein YjdB
MLLTAFAFCITISCSDKSASGPSGLALSDSTAAESRIASASVTLARTSLEVGQTTQATALLLDRYNNPLSLPVVWSTSDSSLATVSGSGLVRARSPGSVSIVATRGYKSGAATLTVVPTTVSVASVTVSLAASSLIVGQTERATATLRDSSNNVVTGPAVVWSSSNASAATLTDSGMVTALAAGSTVISASTAGKTGTAPLAVTATSAPPPTTNPSTVTDLKASVSGSSSVTLSFTQVNDGSGQPAKYDVRYAVAPISWGSAASTTSGTCSTPVAGTATGRQISCTVLGLAPATNYNFQAVAFRGTMNLDAVFGSLSNIAAGTTTASGAPPPASVASVTVSPSSSSLLVGATVQLSATTLDASSNVLTGRVITWSSPNSLIASVNSTGVVTAIGIGTIQVTATSEGKTGSSSITVTIPPPPGSSNEPTGMTLIDERPFNSLGEHAAPYSPAWDTDASLSIVSDATAPKSPSNVLRTTLPTGYAGGTAPGHAGLGFTGHRVLYISYWAKYSTNWWGHLTGVNKHGYAWANGSPIFVMEAEAVGSGPMTLRMAIQGSPSSDKWYTPNLLPGATITRGVWFRMEYVVVGNTAGNFDGTMDFWLDGVHIGSFSGLQYTSGATSWDTFEWRPIWGGVSDVVPATMTLDVDHIYLSGKN